MKLFAFLLFLFGSGITVAPAQSRRPVGERAYPEPSPARDSLLFSDSLNIGRKGRNKIEISKSLHNGGDSLLVLFYVGEGSGWRPAGRFAFEDIDIMDIDAKLADFNNDGFSDITYISALAARGANELRKMFIYDPEGDRLLYLENSEQYPNMQYNNTLNCIDAYLVYGGCSTVFLNISGNKLKPFASVDLFDGLTVREYDASGKDTVIFQDPDYEADYTRFKSYKPLTAYGGKK